MSTPRDRALAYLNELKKGLEIDEQSGSIEALLAPAMAIQITAEAFREIGLVSCAEAKEFIDFAIGAFERCRRKKAGRK
jgi:hypothetical protein